MNKPIVQKERNPLRFHSFISEKVNIDLRTIGSPTAEDDSVFYDKYNQLVEEFLKCGCLCHEVLVENKNGKSMYQSSSPDEVAICQKLKEIGVEFLGLNLGESKVNFFGEERNYEVKMVRKKNNLFRYLILILIGSVRV